MRRTALIAASVLSACSGAPAPDAGVDSGVADAGPQCVGVPARITQYTCVELAGAGAPPCEATLGATVTKHFSTCDAGLGIVGHLSLGACAELDSVRWTYGFPGDTYECFYARDGGAWVGGINFSDRGVLAAGHVGDCSVIAPAMCRDGG